VGGYADWLRQTGGRPAKAAPATPWVAPEVSAAPAPPDALAPPKPASPVLPQRAAGARRLSYKEQRELAALPDTIQRLEQEQAQLHSSLNDPDYFKRDQQAAAAGLERLAGLAAELEAAYSRWDSLESLRAAGGS
jgi:ATP-binding cassette subfamily F protein uup